jgi:circadian clock protein KaiC
MSPSPKDDRKGGQTGPRGPRCRTGIEGLDKILNGGIPAGNMVLLTGACGTGKTTLGIEFLNFGAQQGETGLFLAVTEHAQKVIDNMRTYEFLDPKLIDSRKLQFMDMSAVYEKLGLDKTEFCTEDVAALTKGLADLVKESGAKRLVIDSLTGILLQIKAKERIRDFVSKLGRKLSEAGCTALFVSEIPPGETHYSSFGVEEAVTDGIIILGNVDQRGYLLRTMHIVKMRGTPHSRSKYVIDLTPYGMVIVPLLRSSHAGQTA